MRLRASPGRREYPPAPQRLHAVRRWWRRWLNGLPSSPRNGTVRAISLAARTPAGPFFPIWRRVARTVSSNSPAGTTWWIRPIASARAESKRSAVTKSARAWLCPILRSTNGEMTAGEIPSRASVKPNRVSGAAIAMSQTAARPDPPPEPRRVAFR